MMRKKIVAMLLVFAVLLSLSLSAAAAELPDETRPGSLTIRVRFEGEPVDSGALTVIRVGKIRIFDGNASFVLVDELSGGPSLENLDDPELAVRLAELALEKELPVIRAEIEDGEAVLRDLEPGLYVVTQSDRDAADGFDAIRPFLLSLPQWTDNGYVYDLTAAPKVPLETEPTEPTEPSEPTEPTEPEPELPQTGQLNWPVPVLALLGLAFFCAGWILWFRDRRETHEA